MTSTLAIDPLRAAPDGRYEDERVTVVRGRRPGLRASRHGGRILVEHCLPRVDDDLAEHLAEVLAPLTSEHDVFCRAVVGVVVSGDADPLRAWERFYRASLRRHGGYADVHRHALRLLLPHRSVLDLGASFGFLALHLAGRGTDVVACERERGTADLLRTMAHRLGRRLDVVAGTDTLPDGCVDAVALVHVLEHVDEETGALLLAEATRLARRRVVVAVPYEDEPVALYGHVRRMDDHHLAELGDRTAWATTVHRRHGGWLVLDRP